MRICLVRKRTLQLSDRRVPDGRPILDLVSKCNLQQDKYIGEMGRFVKLSWTFLVTPFFYLTGKEGWGGWSQTQHWPCEWLVLSNSELLTWIENRKREIAVNKGIQGGVLFANSTDNLNPQAQHQHSTSNPVLRVTCWTDDDDDDDDAEDPCLNKMESSPLLCYVYLPLHTVLLWRFWSWALFSRGLPIVNSKWFLRNSCANLQRSSESERKKKRRRRPGAAVWGWKCSHIVLLWEYKMVAHGHSRCYSTGSMSHCGNARNARIEGVGIYWDEGTASKARQESSEGPGLGLVKLWIP